MKNDDKQVLLDVKNLKKYFDVGNKNINLLTAIRG